MADGDAPGEDRQSPPRVPGTPELHLDGFDGPLDLLLDLAGRARIDLGHIPLPALIDQVVAALARTEKHAPIEQRADWLVLATRLLVLRSRLLFAATPKAAEAAEQDAAHALARLRELRFVKAASAWLEARPQLGREVFGRPRRGRDPRVAPYMRLMEACLAALRDRAGEAAQDEPVYRPPVPDLFRVPAAIARLRTLLIGAERPQPLATLLPRLPADATATPVVARSAVASTFVAGLELARVGEAYLDQSAAFAPISVRGAGP